MNKRGQITDLFVFLIVFGILAVVFVNIMPVLIDNFISPQVVNRQFGSLTVLLNNLVILLFVGLVPIVILLKSLQGQAPREV